jgi:hypothetical protein
VSATTRTGIIAGYAQAAGDVTGLEDGDPQRAADRFLAWLAGTGRRWLIVLDDLTDPADPLLPRHDPSAGRTKCSQFSRAATLLRIRSPVLARDMLVTLDEYGGSRKTRGIPENCRRG